MNCSVCFCDRETDLCESCAKLTEQQRRLVQESLRPAVATIRMLNAAFEIAFGAKSPNTKRTVN